MLQLNDPTLLKQALFLNGEWIANTDKVLSMLTILRPARWWGKSRKPAVR